MVTHSSILWVCLVAQMAKNLPAVQETRISSLGWEKSPGEGYLNEAEKNRVCE